MTSFLFVGKTKTAPKAMGAVLSCGSGSQPWPGTGHMAFLRCFCIAKKTPFGVLPHSFSLVITVLSILSVTYMESYVNSRTVPIQSQKRPDFVSQMLKMHLSLRSREKVLQQRHAILRGIAPEDGAKGIHRLFPLSVVGCPADVPDVRLKLFHDFVYILQLLRG